MHQQLQLQLRLLLLLLLRQTKTRQTTRTSKRENSNMRVRNRYKLSAIFSAMLLIGLAVHTAQRKVNAAPPSGGSVTGTIKLDGTPPHPKPIDMSKEPSCAAIHKDHPATTEGVVAGADGSLANVVVYISEGWSGS